MGMEKVDFGWYLKRISASAMVGYLGGIAGYLLLKSPILASVLPTKLLPAFASIVAAAKPERPAPMMWIASCSAMTMLHGREV